MKTNNLLKIYLIILAVFIMVTGINPVSRVIWLLENLLIFLVGITLFSTQHKFQFSKISYTLLFIFLVLGTIGSHYTYEKVPIESLKEILGTERNPNDRIIHFSFGLFMYFPLLEFFVRTSKLKHRFWMYFIPLIIITGLGAMYEIFEWMTAIRVDPVNAQAFLGMQGDIWDAQKDMLLNTLGGVLTMLITIFIKSKKSHSIDPQFKNPYP